MSEDRVPLIELKQEQIALRLKKLEQDLKPKKDLWDIIGATTPLITGILISGIGLYFAYSNNLAQLKLQETQTIEKFIPHLIGNENEKKAAILALSSLISTETAAKYAELFPSEGTASALKSIANSNIQERDKAVANEALVNTFHKLADNYQAAQQPTQAAQAYEQALAAQEKSVDPNFPELLNTLNQLVNIYTNDKKYNLAEATLKRVLRIQKQSSGSRSPQFIDTLNKLAAVFKLDGKTDTAESLSDYANLLAQQKGSSVDPPSVIKSVNTSSDGTADFAIDKPDTSKLNASDGSVAINSNQNKLLEDGGVSQQDANKSKSESLIETNHKTVTVVPDSDSNM